LHERTTGHRARLIAHLADPMATDSRACYAAWLRRQTGAWAQLNLPAVPVASLDWPLASVRPQCLDVVGLLIADLRDLDPGRRRVPLPRTTNGPTGHAPGVCVAAAQVCVGVAELSAGLLASAEALTAGTTATGSATRYLRRCVQLSDRGAGLDRELDSWAASAEPAAVQHAVLFAELFSLRLADAFEAASRTGW
ncbi:MAG TPA: hypothetical protein VHN80_15560, partial [Kineosporiaceae bacterium]|nr:hypothetical protein [Kineosporiaceae bacterium]